MCPSRDRRGDVKCEGRSQTERTAEPNQRGGSDTFFFDNSGASVSGIIDGGAGAGVDVLDYQGNFPGAFATLPSGPATATGGVTNFEGWFL